MVDKALSVRQTEQLAARLTRPVRPKKTEKERAAAVDYAAEVGTRLSQSLGRKVRLIDGRKTGRIEIEFYGADDREALIAAGKAEIKGSLECGDASASRAQFAVGRRHTPLSSFDTPR